ncbi:MAG: hypothetical protein FWC46_08710 [Actinomycetia bacterium]|nr:hypothetical protein [Actinomycetes bacterium]
MRLIAVEWRRLWHRASARWLVVVLVALLALGGWSAWRDSTPPSAAEAAQAQQWYEQNRTDWEQVVQDCRRSQADAQAQSPGTPVDLGCDQLTPPQLSDFVREVVPWGTSTTSLLLLVALAAGLVGLMTGGLFTAGEFGSGVASMWLTFVPGRTKVYASRLVAVGLWTLTLGVIANQVATWLPWVALRFSGQAPTLPPGFWADVWLPYSAYGVGLAVAAALAGAALGFVLRRGVIILALGIVYLVADTIVVGNGMRAARWMLSLVSRAFVAGKAGYTTMTCTNDPAFQGAYSCNSVEHTILRSQTWLELGLLIGILILGGWLVFRRRDVS